MLSPLASIYRDMSPEELPESLTERERAVAVRAAQGLSNEEIASQLFVSVNTVRTHLRAAFRKLDIDRRAKLAEKLR
jgi:LuxR family maltose regulon positive regulatory protein